MTTTIVFPAPDVRLSMNDRMSPPGPVPVAVVDAPVWHETTVHLCDVLDTLEAVREELVAIHRLLEERR